MDLAKKKGATEEEVHDILKETVKHTSHRDGKKRKYSDLVSERFDIKIVRIERSVDKHDIANKWCDFSLETIINLFEQGEQDAQNRSVRETFESTRTYLLSGR